MRFEIALFIGKFLGVLLAPFGRGDRVPGETALKLCPDLLAKFKVKGQVIAVTGSNGKSSVAGMISAMLKKSGKRVLSNADGSNHPACIAAMLVRGATFSGIIDADFVVIKTYERFVKRIFSEIRPEFLLVTNLFRGQTKHTCSVDAVKDQLNEAIGPETVLILNAMDPVSGNLAPDNKRIYFGAEDDASYARMCGNITNDAKVCPRCRRPLTYDFTMHNDIGRFHCGSCGYQSAQAAYLMSQPDLSNGTFCINKTAFSADLKTLFNYMNITAAVAAVCEMQNRDQTTAECLFLGYRTGAKQFWETIRKDRRAVMIRTKNQNPVSFDLNLDYIAAQPETKTVVIYINKNGSKDTSWLYDTAFEELKEKTDSIVCVGPRAYDLAARLVYAGIREDKIIIETEKKKAGGLLKDTRGTVYLLTELNDAAMFVKALG